MACDKQQHSPSCNTGLKKFLCNKDLDRRFSSKKSLHMGLAVHVRRCLHSGFHRSNMCIYLMIHIYIFINKYRYIYLRHALKSICPLLSKVYLRIFYNAHTLAFSTYIRTRVYKDTYIIHMCLCKYSICIFVCIYTCNTLPAQLLS